MTADFAGAQSGNEVVAVYEVPKDRAHQVSIFASNCNTPEGLQEDAAPGLIAVNTTSSGKDDNWDVLTPTSGTRPAAGSSSTRGFSWCSGT